MSRRNKKEIAVHQYNRILRQIAAEDRKVAQELMEAAQQPLPPPVPRSQPVYFRAAPSAPAFHDTKQDNRFPKNAIPLIRRS